MWHSNHLRSITIFNGIESIPKWDLFMAARVYYITRGILCRIRSTVSRY